MSHARCLVHLALNKPCLRQPDLVERRAAQAPGTTPCYSLRDTPSCLLCKAVVVVGEFQQPSPCSAFQLSYVEVGNPVRVVGWLRFGQCVFGPARCPTESRHSAELGIRPCL